MRPHRLGVAVAAIISIAVGTTAFAAKDVATICHVPADDPDRPVTIRVDASAVADHLAHGDTEGACPPTASELDPPAVAVDTAAQPPAAEIPGVDGGPPRPLDRLTSEVGDGYQFDFVRNEVTLITANPAELADFMSRWPSTLLFQVDLADPGPAAEPTVLYLLNVDPSRANTSQLNRDLARLSPNLYGRHWVSSESALQLLSVVAAEIRRNGLRLGLNVLLQSNDLARRTSTEAPLGEDLTDDSLTFAYARNAFEWPYARHEGSMPGPYEDPLDTGAAEALRVVGAAGRLGNRVRVLIADGGFYPNADFPPFTPVGAMRTPNPDPSGCGAGAPASPGTPCEAHGTHVTLTGFGLPDNGFGTFGPGGPVTDLVLLQSPSVDFSSVLRFITDAIPAALSNAPRIINVSASTSIPGGWCFIACEPFDYLAEYLDDRGILFVAAAGNDGISVDNMDRFCFLVECVRFEEAAFLPCEADHVLCVGANRSIRQRRATYSNFGVNPDDPNSVDIYAPGDVYSVDALSADESNDPPVDDLQVINGTSFATPFTSGVLALAMASNPALTSAQVRSCLMSTSFPQFPSFNWRAINALGTVACAMGGSHPYVEIVTPGDGRTYFRGSTAVELRARADDYEDGSGLTIYWTSSMDGALGTSGPGAPLSLGPFGLQLGDHDICAMTTDTSGLSAGECVSVRVYSAIPVVHILQPPNGAIFSLSSLIALNGTAADPDGPVPTDIEWRISPSGSTGSPTVVATDLSASVPASALGPGEYMLTLVARDAYGLGGSDSVNISITEDPENLPPSIIISEPLSGTAVDAPDSDPVQFSLVASAQDPEDGPIPFGDIEWFVSTNGAAEEPLTVTAMVICTRFEPDPVTGENVCVDFETQYRFELLPQAFGTRYDIKGRVQDSDGNFNESANGRVTVFINLLG